MYEINIDTNKNVAFLKLVGFMEESEATEAADALIANLKKLKPGCTLVNDISEFKATSEESAKQIKRGQAAVFEIGVKRVIRVVGKAAISQMQFNRVQREGDADYETVEVRTMDEAMSFI